MNNSDDFLIQMFQEKIRVYFENLDHDNFKRDNTFVENALKRLGDLDRNSNNVYYGYLASEVVIRISEGRFGNQIDTIKAKAAFKKCLSFIDLTVDEVKYPRLLARNYLAYSYYEIFLELEKFKNPSEYDEFEMPEKSMLLAEKGLQLL